MLTGKKYPNWWFHAGEQQKRNHIYHKSRFRSLLKVKFTPLAPTFGYKRGRPTLVKGPGPGLLKTQKSTNARPWIILWSMILYSIMWSVYTQLFCYNTCIYSIRFLAGECNLSCSAFVSVLLQAVLFSLMKIKDQFLSQFCKFKWQNTVKSRRVNVVRVAI